MQLLGGPENNPPFILGWGASVLALFHLRIGFTFDFYGTGYTNAYVSSNGRIHFTTSSAGTPSLNLPSNSYKLVAPVNEDMYVRTASEVYYKQATGPTRLIIQYNR